MYFTLENCLIWKKWAGIPPFKGFPLRKPGEKTERVLESTLGLPYACWVVVEIPSSTFGHASHPDGNMNAVNRQPSTFRGKSGQKQSCGERAAELS